jgi:glycosyltransferase involved in cell wall biosynthesis
MRVLKIIHTMGHGGAENIFRWLAWQLKREGIDVVAGIPRQKDPYSENWITPALKELDIPYETFDKSGTAFDLFKNLRSLIARIRPDIVHSHLLDSNFYSSLACRSLSISHICTEHGDIAIKNDFSERIKFVLLSMLSKSVICVSEAVRRHASRFTPFSGKLGLVYNGISFSDDRGSTCRKEFGIPTDALLIGNVGNLYLVKGQRFLVEAFSHFLEFFPNSYLLFVGRGSEKENLQNQVDRLGISSEKVIFTGFRSDVGNILRSLDIYVHPSLSEGLPVSLLEALSSGVPVIATNVGGVAEILGNNEHGILVPPGSSDDLYECMMKVAGNLHIFKEKSTVSQRMVRDKFSLDAMAQKYIEIYECVLGNKK